MGSTSPLPTAANSGSGGLTGSPLAGGGTNTLTNNGGAHTPKSNTSDPWPSQSDEDIDRLVAMHQHRQNSLSSLGIRSDSMASVYSGAGEGRYGTVTVKGQIEFGMQYNYKQGALEIFVKQCKELAAVDTKRNRSDPYVKVSCLFLGIHMHTYRCEFEYEIHVHFLFHLPGVSATG